MRKAAMLITAALLLAAPAAFAQTDVNVGDKAPKFEADAWYNLPKNMKAVTQSDLKGQIVLVGFWSTGCRSCQRSILHLSEMQSKFRSKGVIFLAITGEGESRVEPYIAKNKVTYVVGCGARRAERDYGIKDCHTAFLIDTEGKVAWKGHPALAEGEVTKLLMAKPPKKKGFLAEASAGEALKKAEKLDKERKYVEAIEGFEMLAKEYKGTKEADKAAAKLKDLKSNSKIMDIVRKAKADKEADGWLEIARACVQYGDKEDAVKYYDRILKKHPETNAGRFAREEVAPMKKKSKADDEDDDKKPGDKGKKSKAKMDREEQEDEEEEEEEGEDEDDTQDGDEDD